MVADIEVGDVAAVDVSVACRQVEQVDVVGTRLAVQVQVVVDDLPAQLPIRGLQGVGLCLCASYELHFADIRRPLVGPRALHGGGE